MGGESGAHGPWKPSPKVRHGRLSAVETFERASFELLEFKMRCSARFVAVALSVLATFPSLSMANDPVETMATETYTFWIGDTKNGNERPQPLVGCNDKHVIAQSICTVNQPDGLKRLYNYTLKRIHIQSGGKCGYAKYEVGCLGMPSVSGNRKQTYSFGDSGANYGCGSDQFQTGRTFCTVHGPDITRFPFTTRVTRAVDGGRCGTTTIEFACRDPFPTQLND